MKQIKQLTSSSALISSVAGTAFVDWAADQTIPAMAVGKYVEILDVATGKKAKGYVKAIGSEETLSEVLTNPSFDVNTSDWSPHGGISTIASVAGGFVNNCLQLTRVSGSGQDAYTSNASITPVGALFKASIYVKSGTSGNEAFEISMYKGSGQYHAFANGTSSGDWTQYSGYKTSTVNDRFYIWKKSETAGTMLFDEASLKQVLTPSTYGFTISSNPNLTDQSWAEVESGFTYNSTYTVTIYDQYYSVGSNPIVKYGSCTQANSRISVVDGTAFVDFSASAFSADNIRNNDFVEIFDSAKRKIGGFIKAAGSGSGTFGSELVIPQANRDFSGSPSWDSWNIGTFDVSGDMSISGSVGARVKLAQANAAMSVGALCCLYVDVANISGSWTIGDEELDQSYFVLTGNGAAQGGLFNARTTGGLTVRSNITTSSGDFDNFTLKQQTAPSSTGVTITNTPGGATYNWGVKDASFNYNDSSGYTYRIISRQAYSTLILNQATTSGTLHLATVDGGAMFFHDSVDFSSYAGDDAGVTLYEMVFEDAAGKCAVAYGAAQGGGESLGAEKILVWTQHVTYSYGTFTLTDGDPTHINPAVASAYSVAFVPQQPAPGFAMTAGTIYKLATTYTLNSGANGKITVTDGDLNDLWADATLSTQNSYKTSKVSGTSGRIAVSNLSAGDWTLDISLKPLIDIPTTGLHLVSALGGTTRNMARTDSGFDPNTVVKVRVYRTGQTDTTATALLDDTNLFLLDDAGAILTED